MKMRVRVRMKIRFLSFLIYIDVNCIQNPHLLIFPSAEGRLIGTDVKDV